MNIKTLALGGSAALALIATGFSANAAVVDKPTFKVGGLVVVWGATSAGGDNVVSDFYLLDGTDATDLIAGDVIGDADFVLTGDLLPTLDGTALDPNNDGVLDASDTLSAFGVTASTDVDAGDTSTAHSGQFFVASNTGFRILATAVEDVNTFTGLDLSDVAFDMTLDAPGTATPVRDGATLNFGAAAQDPTTGGTGFATLATLDLLEAGDVEVFDGGRRTAATPGNLAAQSVRFNTSYQLDTDPGTAGVQGFDLSAGTGSLEATVTYTIYNP